MEFHVKGMACGGCAKSVTKAITSLDSGARVVTDISTRTVRIESLSSQSEVERGLSEAGFPAVPK